MKAEDLWTIEVNLDYDFMSSCAWHIDNIKTTVVRNVNAGINKKKTQRWVLVGLATSNKEALVQSKEIQTLMAMEELKRHLVEELREPRSLPIS